MKARHSRHKALNILAAKAKSPAHPAVLDIQAAMTIEAAAAPQDGAAPAPRRFTMAAYNGGEMMLGGWGYPVVVDLQGMNTGNGKPRPILLDHQPDVDHVMGQADTFEITRSTMKVKGAILGKSGPVQAAIDLHDAGFAWQSSIGARADVVEFVKPNATATANGKTFKGPIYIARKSTLGEISFVVLGADDSTTARIAAEAANHKENAMNYEQWLQAKGFDPATITEQQTASLRAMYDDEQAEPTGEPPVPPPPPPVQAAATNDLVTSFRAEMRAETTRVAAIRRICAGRHADIEAQAIADGWDEVKAELAVLRADRPRVNAPHGSNAPSDRQVIEATALINGGIPADRLVSVHRFSEQVVEAAAKMRGVGIQDLFRIAARAEGIELPAFSGTGGDFIRAAFSTLSLPGILSNVANKLLLDGYNYTENAWRTICKITSVNDFKQHTRYRLTDDMKFEAVATNGELKHGSLGEQSFTQQADTYGKMFALDRKLIINDDLAAFAAIPTALGIGAADAIAEAVWTLLLSNPSSFFAAGNANLATGAGTALSIDGLTQAEQMFRDQTKPNGRPLGLSARYLLVPTGLAVTAGLLYKSPMVNELTTANKPKPSDNPHTGQYEPVVSAYLNNASISGYSTTAWYLFADPNRLAALEVAFLNGVDRPTVEQAEADFNTLGMQFRGYIDFGVKEQDPRAAVKMAGA